MNSGISTAADLAYLEQIIARKDFAHFAQCVVPGIEMTPFHCAYYHALNLFAHGVIKRLIVSVPPQHGKSLGSSQLLPAYMLGVNPDLKIAIASYAFSLATKFNKRVQRIISGQEYRTIFPQSALKGSSPQASASGYIQTSEEFEIVGRQGSLRSVGREGALTGNPVDIMILDDLYKDAMEGNSPIVRENAWEWYTSVVKTRLHNNSQELIVFTRWHEDDLIGRLEEREEVVGLHSFDQTGRQDVWYKLNFEAIKKSDPTGIDPREHEAALWPERHSLSSLEGKRKLDPVRFDCMYQGQPSSREGLLYGDGFPVYEQLPNDTIKKANYTDTADMGTDYLCSICYDVGKDGRVYVTDILYTQEPMEVTEPATARMLLRNATRVAYIESNNGGRGFARAVGRLAGGVKIEWLHQSANKESRILTNAATVLKFMTLPADWRIRWPQFYAAVCTYKRLFRANASDDAADTLTGIVEVEVLKMNKDNRIKSIGFTN